MELFTRAKEPGWDRIVHIKVDKISSVAEIVSDNNILKLLVINEGRLIVEINNARKVVIAPALIFLSDEDIKFIKSNDLSLTIIYFRGTEVRDEFTMERLQSGEFEKEMGRTILQDYLLVKNFISQDDISNKIITINSSAHLRVLKLVDGISKELDEQEDGFWPCRSRSILMEILFDIRFLCVEDGKLVIEAKTDKDIVGEIIQFMSEHISDKIMLEDILKEYSTNRNQLNAMFIKETSMTCLSYLEKMRINLAQIMLADTELQVSEIADRVGYLDPNYFVKVFKKHTGVTPSNYRRSCM